jgi:Fe-S oxidoreductase
VELGVRKIVTLSPHSFNAFKNDYPELGGNFDVLHYTQLLRDLVKNGMLKFRHEFKHRVTYHDSCFLGRHNNEYEAPRAILRGIRSLDLLEMERNRNNSFCCGGGGGNFFSDLLGVGEDSPSRIRVREAHDIGSDVLAVACPICAKMLDTAVKAEELEERLRVMDICEIVKEVL